DYHVTGVQTCALPICRVTGTCHCLSGIFIIDIVKIIGRGRSSGYMELFGDLAVGQDKAALDGINLIAHITLVLAGVHGVAVPFSSEERRVGKECSSRC